MKLLLLNAGLAVCLLPGAVEAGGPGAEGALLNGDVNCSGVVDMSDAVYILNWLFLGAERPCPLAEPPHLLEQIATLEAEVRASREEFEATQAMLAAARAELGRTQKELAEAQVQLASCNAGKEECEAGLAEAEASLAGCEADLSETEDALAAAEERLAGLEVPGCMDPEAVNFDSIATIDDGSCCYSPLLFAESFDGPELPETLSYLEGDDWAIDNFNQLYAAGEGGGHALSNTQFSFSDESLLLCSADMGKPRGASGSYLVALDFGEYRLLFHPGWRNGAFRLERHVDGREEVLVANQDMGFEPVTGELHRVEALFARQGEEVSIRVYIGGTGSDCSDHTYSYLFVERNPSFSGARIGVFALGPAIFDNIRVLDGPCEAP